jgi:hypothetical protein
MDIFVFFFFIASFSLALYGLWYISIILEKLNKSTEKISNALEKLEDTSNRMRLRQEEKY